MTTSRKYRRRRLAMLAAASLTLGLVAVAVDPPGIEKAAPPLDADAAYAGTRYKERCTIPRNVTGLDIAGRSGTSNFESSRTRARQMATYHAARDLFTVTVDYSTGVMILSRRGREVVQFMPTCRLVATQRYGG
jgi:hypothetical protein